MDLKPMIDNGLVNRVQKKIKDETDPFTKKLYELRLARKEKDRETTIHTEKLPR